MLGFGDGRIIRDLTTASAQLVGILDVAGIGQPAGFWREPYVVGYLFGTVSALAKINSEGKIKGERGGQIALQVIQQTAGVRAGNARDEIIRCLRNNDPVFARAGRCAVQVASFAYGLPDTSPDIDHQAAMEHGYAMAFAAEGATDETTARNYGYERLLRTHWINEVRDRFDV